MKRAARSVIPRSIHNYWRRNTCVCSVIGRYVENVEYDSICTRGITLLVWNVYIDDWELEFFWRVYIGRVVAEFSRTLKVCSYFAIQQNSDTKNMNCLKFIKPQRTLHWSIIRHSMLGSRVSSTSGLRVNGTKRSPVLRCSPQHAGDNKKSLLSHLPT